MPTFMAHVVRTEATPFGTMFTVAFLADDRAAAKMLLLIERDDVGSFAARFFDLDVDGEVDVVLGRA